MYETNMRFKVFLAENGIKHKKVAKLLNLNPSRFSLKLNEKKSASFTMEELRIIKKEYDILIDDYFF